MKWSAVAVLVALMLLWIGILVLPAQVAQSAQEPPLVLPRDAAFVQEQAESPEIWHYTNPALITDTTAHTSYMPIVHAQQAFEDELIDLINAERSKQGTGTLRKSSVLMQVAEAHSRDWRDTGSPDDTWDFLDRVKNGGYNWQHVGWAWDSATPTPQDVFNGWMGSQTINSGLILSSLYTEIGVGYVAGGTRSHYWSAVFATPR